MNRPGRTLLLALGVATALPACDNMSWGGTSLTLARPAPKEAPTGVAEDKPAEALPPLPEGPLLYLVTRDTSGPHIRPIAEIAGPSLMELPREVLAPGANERLVESRIRPGTEFNVFADGNRVGRFITAVDGSQDAGLCLSRPAVSGVLEVIPEAASESRFIALARGNSDALSRGLPSNVTSTRRLRFESTRIFGEQIPLVGARWPRDAPGARAELSLFGLRWSDSPGMTSTYLFRDQLAVSPPRQGAYALFFLAERGPDRYRPSFVWYRPADRDGKGAPRFVGQLDWNRDGREEILLEVLGEDSRWFAALGRDPSGAWSLIYEDTCGQPRAPIPPTSGD